MLPVEVDELTPAWLSEALDADVSKVTVSSLFHGVSRKLAECILEMAAPYNWARALPTFFPSVQTGELVDNEFKAMADVAKSIGLAK